METSKELKMALLEPPEFRYGHIERDKLLQLSADKKNFLVEHVQQTIAYRRKLAQRGLVRDVIVAEMTEREIDILLSCFVRCKFCYGIGEPTDENGYCSCLDNVH